MCCKSYRVVDPNFGLEGFFSYLKKWLYQCKASLCFEQMWYGLGLASLSGARRDTVIGISEDSNLNQLEMLWLFTWVEFWNIS